MVPAFTARFNRSLRTSYHTRFLLNHFLGSFRLPDASEFLGGLTPRHSGGDPDVL
ncbi:hypothetical protein BH23GEM6_BH23GEM6_10850 [soil metagenome]